MTHAALIARQLELERALAIERARRDFLSFITYQMPEYRVNWHHRVMANALQKVADGKCPRLIVTLPPRHGKSQQVSMHFPAYVLGRNPKAQIIAASYNATLAAKMNRAVQRIIDSPEYRRIFPGTRLNEANVRSMSGSWLRNSDEFEVVEYGGIYRSAGVGGSATGYGATVGIVDDPVRNRQDADSPTYQERVIDWFRSTFLTRLMKGGSIIIVLTRWSQGDLVGRLLEHAQANPAAGQWEVLNLPAIAEEDKHELDPRATGDALWPSEFSLKWLAEQRATMTEREFASLYQQRPSPQSGHLVQREWFKFWTTLPSHFDFLCISADLNFTSTDDSDFTVMLVMGRSGNQFYVIDRVRARMGWIQQKQWLRSLVNKYPANNGIFIESAANGFALVEEARQSIPGVVPVKPLGSKAVRLESVTPLIESGCVLLPAPATGQLWAEELIDECCVFPGGRNDDQVDALSMGLAQMRQRHVDFGSWSVESMEKPSAASLAF